MGGADAGFVQAVLRAQRRIELQRAHLTYRAVAAAMGADDAFVKVMEAAEIGSAEAERLAWFRKADAAATRMAAAQLGE